VSSSFLKLNMACYGIVMHSSKPIQIHGTNAFKLPNICYICFVKKVIAICFMFMFLSAYTAVGQILRLPTLVHHFLEHVEQENASLQTFLAEHYASQINHPDDIHNDHQNLPFKALDHQQISVVALVNVPTTILFTTSPFPSVMVKKADRTQSDFSKSYLNSIWQPPRVG